MLDELVDEDVHAQLPEHFGPRLYRSQVRKALAMMIQEGYLPVRLNESMPVMVVMSAQFFFALWLLGIAEAPRVVNIMIK